MLLLKFGLKFEDLNSLNGIQKLDQEFLLFLTEQDLSLSEKYIEYRSNLSNIPEIKESELLLEISPYLDDFISILFDIEEQNNSLKLSHKQFDLIYECRRKFVQRIAVKKYGKKELDSLSFEKITELLANLIGEVNQENIVQQYSKWQSDSKRYNKEIDILAQYCSFMVHLNSSLPLFDIPQIINQDDLIQKRKIEKLQKSIYLGFDYRDHETSISKSVTQAKYCLYCHKRQKDTCRTGFKNIDPENPPEKNGCPLKQKISEMSLLQSQGFNISALAMIVIDNPMVAATGHRICNDCMKSCIYQQQDPVNIPIIESNILQQVLSLDWGTEVYLLLTKWNPLNLKSPLPLVDSGYNVLVTGLGPAGFALSHYLLRLGHKVVAIDGLKISPMDFDYKHPIKLWREIEKPLSKRNPEGFGGVAEYGITNRWNKNNLTLIRLILERNQNFILQGSVRLGSNITVQQAFECGFHHIALCLGAGKPRYQTLPGFFAKGVRPAADFLMNLQQGGAFLSDSNIKLMVRMPAVIIGCGLTAIDSAVELLHYYPAQVEKFLHEYENKKNLLQTLSKHNQEIAREFILHAQLLRKATTDNERLSILHKMGGVTICYRKSVSESPAYRLNHEEVEHAMSLGINFEEFFSPKEIITDGFNHVKKIISEDNRSVIASTVLIAIGVDDNNFTDIKNLNSQNGTIFKNDDRNISHFGDCNQKYAGSVVKALASAKDGYEDINTELQRLKPKKLEINIQDFKSKITEINALSKNLLELKIYSPYGARNFRPGQFFKIENYSKDNSKIIKPMALSGVKVDKISHIITLCVFNSWNVNNIQNNLSIGDDISLMGPSGSPITISKGKKIILIADNFNNIALSSIASLLYKNNCEITYFANYTNSDSLYNRAEIEEHSYKVIWSSPGGQLVPRRKQDLSFNGELIESIIAAKKSRLIDDADQIICYVSPEIRQKLNQIKKQIFGNRAKMICSINAPMQCMMKGICGQCITLDENTGNYVFACIKQYS